MIKANFNAYGSYVTDSLYQWDLNQVLQVIGLRLDKAPEVHFANADMDRAIPRQATLENGVMKVNVPNTILQHPLRIHAYIGIYEGDTFKVIEKVEIPVIPKKRPTDYVFEDTDGEIYSYNNLENQIANIRDLWIETHDQQVKSNVYAWLEGHPEVTTTVQDNELTVDKLVVGTLGYVTPEMFGAVGDGVTDDTDAVNSAIEFAIAEGCTVKIPKGTYVVSSPLNITGGVTIVGLSSRDSILKLASGSNCDLIDIVGSDFSMTGITIRDICLMGDYDYANNVKTSTVGYGLKIERAIDVDGFSMNNVIIQNFAQSGLYVGEQSWMVKVSNCTLCYNAEYGYYGANGTDNIYSDMAIHQNGLGGIRQVSGSFNKWTNSKVYLNSKYADALENKLYAGGIVVSTNVADSFNNIDVQENYFHGVVLDGCNGVRLANLVFDDNGYRREDNLYASMYLYGSRYCGGNLRFYPLENGSLLAHVLVSQDCLSDIFSYTLLGENDNNVIELVRYSNKVNIDGTLIYNDVLGRSFTKEIVIEESSQFANSATYVVNDIELPKFYKYTPVSATVVTDFYASYGECSIFKNSLLHVKVTTLELNSTARPLKVRVKYEAST